MIYGGIIIFVLGLLFLRSARKKKSTQGELAKTKSLPINQLAAGRPAEVQGTIVAKTPLQTPFSHRDCIYYEYEVERETRVRDDRGQLRTDWERVHHDENKVSFWVQDNSGKILIDPEKAKIEAQDLGQHFDQAGDSFENPIRHGLARTFSGHTRVTEEALLVGSPVYVYGEVREGSEGLVIAKGQGDFIISYKTEEQVEKSIGRSAGVLKVLGYIGIILGIFLAVYSFFQ